MSYLDVTYINLISSQLLKFSKKKDYLYNFRCPYCGDSKKRKDKARGYLFKIKNDFVFKCHNCGVGRTFTNFLKENNKMLHDQYVMERYRDGLTGKGSNTPSPKMEFKKPVFKKKKEDVNLVKISDLDSSHPAREYLENRKIKDIDYFFYCPKFKEWTNSQKHTFDDMRGDSPRIILPMYTEDKKMFGYQGRSLSKASRMRYITIMIDESHPKIFGLDRIDTSKTVYVTEGPFDSMFIENSIAMCGSDVNLSEYNFDFVYIYDNEPRNNEIVNRITSSIDKGCKVVIWPSSVVEKDINDMVLTGHNVQEMVQSNVYSGLEAKLKLSAWKKV